MFVWQTYLEPGEAPPAWVPSLELALTLYFLLDFALILSLSRHPLVAYFSISGIVDVLTIWPPLAARLLALENPQFGQAGASAGLVEQATRALRVFRALRVLRVARLAPSYALERQLFLLVLAVVSFVFATAGLILAFEDDDTLPFHQALYYATSTVVGRPGQPVSEGASYVALSLVIIISASVLPTIIAQLVKLWFQASDRTSYSPSPQENRRHVVITGAVGSAARISPVLDHFFHTGRDPATVPAMVVLGTEKLQGRLQTLVDSFRFGGAVTYIRGSCQSLKDLRRAGAHRAGAFLYLTDTAAEVPDGVRADAAGLASALAIKASAPTTRIVAQTRRPHGRSHMSTVPGWAQGDMAMSVSDLEMGLLAAGAVLPGVTTLISNLVHMGSPADTRRSNAWGPLVRGLSSITATAVAMGQGPEVADATAQLGQWGLPRAWWTSPRHESKGKARKWSSVQARRPAFAEYAAGFGQELHRFSLPCGLANRTFAAAARLAYLRHGVLMIAARVAVPVSMPGLRQQDGESESRTTLQIQLFPGDAMLIEGWTAFCLARSEQCVQRMCEEEGARRSGGATPMGSSSGARHRATSSSMTSKGGRGGAAVLPEAPCALSASVPWPYLATGPHDAAFPFENVIDSNDTGRGGAIGRACTRSGWSAGCCCCGGGPKRPAAGHTDGEGRSKAVPVRWTEEAHARASERWANASEGARDGSTVLALNAVISPSDDMAEAATASLNTPPLRSAAGGIVSPGATDAPAPLRGHILVCGANENIGLLARALVSGPSGLPVAVLCPERSVPTHDAMERAHRGSSDWLAAVRIVHGDPTHAADLMRAGARTARAAIVLAPARGAGGLIRNVAMQEGGATEGADLELETWGIAAASALFAVNPALHTLTQLHSGKHARFIRPTGVGLRAAQTAAVGATLAASPMQPLLSYGLKRTSKQPRSRAKFQGAAKSVLKGLSVKRALTAAAMRRPASLAAVALAAARAADASSSLRPQSPAAAGATGAASPAAGSPAAKAASEGVGASAEAAADTVAPGRRGGSDRGLRTRLSRDSHEAGAGADEKQPAHAGRGRQSAGRAAAPTVTFADVEAGRSDGQDDDGAVAGASADAGSDIGEEEEEEEEEEVHDIDDDTALGMELLGVAAAQVEQLIAREQEEEEGNADEGGEGGSGDAPALSGPAPEAGAADADAGADTSGQQAVMVGDSSGASTPSGEAHSEGFDDFQQHCDLGDSEDEYEALRQGVADTAVAMGGDAAASVASGAAQVSPHRTGFGETTGGLAPTPAPLGAEGSGGGRGQPTSAPSQGAGAGSDAGAVAGGAAATTIRADGPQPPNAPATAALPGSEGAAAPPVPPLALPSPPLPAPTAAATSPPPAGRGAAGEASGSGAAGPDDVHQRVAKGATNEFASVRDGAEEALVLGHQAEELAAKAAAGEKLTRKSRASGRKMAKRAARKAADAQSDPSTASNGPGSAGVWGAPAFAAGRAFASTSLDAMALEALFTPHVVTISSLMVRAVRKGTLGGMRVAALVCELHLLDRPLAAGPTGPSESGSAEDTTEPPVPSGFIPATYGQLFEAALRERGVLCIGLYRRIAPWNVWRTKGKSWQDGDESEGFRFRPWQLQYVLTNPAADTLLGEDDLVYVLKA
ncbi:hypothetical protein FNF29_07370 [Cafeteria roenbergensis]|uniref:Ion transport domain-containing protein n=1 Tax=Cafeteria roenbergensis TaxID=33653 RepID=A0A5A8C3Q4_CAFRO|nr:hypothetical protein FNF29_07370 [Cafeteria roenbergensis]|eukprot:KAA0147425.1 hypothetical protein FNF29_07370 [Cafeteria roenbergensis]